jgi:hypothetical protein
MSSNDEETKSIGDVVVSVLISVRQISAVDHSFKPQMGHKDYKIYISCLSYKYAALRWVHRLCLAWNQDNVSEWRNMAIGGLLFHCAGTLKAN